MARRRPQRPPWWSEWPAAILLGLGSFAMVLTASLPLLLYALLTGGTNEAAGTDLDPASGPGIGWRVLYVVLAVVILVLPAATVWTARRRLLGFLLWALVGSAVAMAAGLWMFGIL